MPLLRFNHVFVALMLLAGLSAFVIPQQHTEFLKDALNGFLAPVQKPVNAIAYAIHRHFASPATTQPEDSEGPQTIAGLQEKNRQQEVIIANLVVQLEELKKRDSEQEALGDLRKLCVPFDVASADDGTRETLALAGTSREGLAKDMPVLCPDGLAGRIDHATMAGARALLITDPASKVFGSFARLQRKDAGYEFVHLSARRFGVDGGGPGKLLITTLRKEDITLWGVQAGDWVILADDDWPRAVQGVKLGIIDSIEPQKTHPLFVTIVVKPGADLRRLREVMVMVKQ